MNNSQILKKYLQLQKDIMFDQLFEMEGATVCYCKNDPSPFWNNAFIDTPLNADHLLAVSGKLQSLERAPAFYFENSIGFTDFKVSLENKGFVKTAEDSLMFYTGKEIDQKRFEDVRKVDSLDDLEIFLDTFDRSYVKDDPINPYGELGDYLTAARVAWEKHHASNRLEYFVAYKDTEPVAVSSLTNFESIGYISNVGSVLAVRGEGYGKLATLYCVDQSQKNGNTLHFLATEEGTNPHSFYTAIGFRTEFTTYLMVRT